MTDPLVFDDVIGWASGPLPEEVEAKARLLLLDSIGCIAAGLRHDEVRRAATTLAVWCPGDIALPGIEPRLGPAGTAALAGMAMCWDEVNEGLARAHGRPGLAVVPLLLAFPGLPLSRLIAALALGYEVGGRAGELWRIRPGMHVDGSWHSLGAAATAAALTGADPARAVRIAACQIPFSLYRPLSFGMTGRNSYAGHAVLLGLIAASAAQAGSDAPADGLAEARRIALLKDDAPARAPAGEWLMLEAYLKPYAGVRHAHYAAAAAIELRERLGGSEAIRAVRLDTYGEALTYAAIRAPKTPIAAQFSLSFGIAAALRFGDLGPDAYRALDDAELQRLEALVELREDPAMTAAGLRAARVSVETDAGEISAAADRVAGDPGYPMSPEAAEAKFRRLAEHLSGAGRLADAILRGPPDVALPPLA